MNDLDILQSPPPIQQANDENKTKISTQAMNDKIDDLFTKEFSDQQLYRVFLLLFACNVLVNIDHGTLPGCVEEVKTKLKIENVGFGSLGTAVYAGLTVGSAMGTKIYQNTTFIKVLLSVSMALNGVFLVSFSLASTLWANLLIRFLTGMFQINICIFTPVWADTYGSEKLKNIWITVLLLSSPLGIFFGFILTSFVAHAEGFGWEWSFYIQSGLIIPTCFCFYLVDSKYLDVQAANKFRKKCQAKIEAKFIDGDKK